MKKTLLFTAATLFATSVFSGEFGDLESFVPASGTVVADVMVFAAPPEIEQISLKIQTALQANAEWAQDYISRAKPGQPLAYHPNMGVTEAEYSKLLAGANKLELVKRGETELSFENNENGETLISGLPGPESYSTVSYLLENDVMQTSFGQLETKTHINQQDESSPLGVWAGEQWSLENIASDGDYAVVKIAFGLRQNDSKAIVYYDAKVASQGQPQELSYVLVYDLD